MEIIKKEVKDLAEWREQGAKGLQEIEAENKPKLARFEQLAKDKQAALSLKSEVDKLFSARLSNEITDDQLEQRVRELTQGRFDVRNVQQFAALNVETVSARTLRETDNLKSELTESVEKLETLDLRRLKTQARVIRNIAKAEENFLLAWRSEVNVVLGTWKNVNIEQDINSHAHYMMNEHFPLDLPE